MAVKKKDLELPPEKLRWNCQEDGFCVECSDELDFSEEIIGQPRAIEAIKVGLDVTSLGYNIFITGLAGTGRTTTIRKLLQQLKSETEDAPPDILYVYNFGDPDRPKVIYLPSGEGKRFRSDMETFIKNLSENLAKLFESDVYKNKRKDLIRRSQDKQKELIDKFQEEIKKENFALVQVQVGQFPKLDLQPLFDGKPISFDELNVLVQEGKIPKEVEKQFIDKYQELEGRLDEIFKQGRAIAAELEDKLKKLNDATANPMIESMIEDIKERYDSSDIDQHLDDIKQHVIDNLDTFLKKEKGQQQAAQQMIPGMQIQQPQQDPFLPYRVNLLVDNSKTKGRPIIEETNPTFRNIFGVIERDVNGLRGGSRTDFTKIKAGSLLKATGGFLVVNAMDVLTEPGVWQNLKRSLRNNIIEVQSYDPFYLFSASALKPEQIKANIKIVMIGDYFLYHLLSHHDDDFRKIFKIKAEFDTVMDRDDNTLNKYCIFINKIVTNENLIHFDASGMAAIAEFGVRLAGRKKKLSTRFNVIADLIRESSYHASKDDAERVNYDHVQKAIDGWIRRVNLPEDKIQELYDEGTLMVDTEGTDTGQINGLAVYSLGDYAFGRPTRITVTTSLGRKGVINIERESDLSGKTHDKGVLILEGYLSKMFAQTKPITMNASICFEQSYSGVDGDSASSTEMFCLLSALSGLPLRQDLAVTGSMNQNGEIQPIGGVNEKIEGFFKVCKNKGLTGKQGCIIPKKNVNDLMLDHDVVEAVKEGKFHIYAIEYIAEGIELLTGKKAGEKNSKGEFPKGTIHYLVDQQLEEYMQTARKITGDGNSILKPKPKKRGSAKKKSKK
ncbi:MAG: AAA family ATPase [candidate division Zixibacteria bacterium]|nr:AAA family ATPase [candidate division Zixibacteria bacterium]